MPNKERSRDQYQESSWFWLKVKNTERGKILKLEKSKIKSSMIALSLPRLTMLRKNRTQTRATLWLWDKALLMSMTTYIRWEFNIGLTASHQRRPLTLNLKKLRMSAPSDLMLIETISTACLLSTMIWVPALRPREKGTHRGFFHIKKKRGSMKDWRLTLLRRQLMALSFLSLDVSRSHKFKNTFNYVVHEQKKEEN